MKKTVHINIREAVAADLPVLVNFLVDLDLHVSGGKRQSLTDDAMARLKKDLRKYIRDSEKRLVVSCTTSNNVVGMGTISVWHSPNLWEETEGLDIRCGFIDNLWVMPKYRKQGVMLKILESLLEFAESNKLEELLLEYSISNQEAADAWQKLGFRATGVRAAAFTSTVRQKLNPESGNS